MRLSICIPTIVGRESQCEKLVSKINSQIEAIEAESDIEVLVDKDNKEVSIGVKRQRMYEAAKGIYTVQIDDDDDIASNFVKEVYLATFSDADCIGYMEECLIDKRLFYSKFSVTCGQWKQLRNPLNGITYYRTPFHKTPIKTDLCREVGVKDMRFGEDEDFSRRILPKLKSEVFINQVMYYYYWSSINRSQFNERYGIK